MVSLLLTNGPYRSTYHTKHPNVAEAELRYFGTANRIRNDTNNAMAGGNGSGYPLRIDVVG